MAGQPGVRFRELTGWHMSKIHGEQFSGRGGLAVGGGGFGVPVVMRMLTSLIGTLDVGSGEA
jgi:hypothetical protein